MATSSETHDIGSAPTSTVRMFGVLDVQVKGAPMPPLRSRKGQWLLSLLLLRGGQNVDRAWLAFCLWPDTTEARALVSLRQSLADLRSALGAEAWRLQASGAQTLRLEIEGLDIDLFAFDRLIAQGDNDSLEKAVALYRGVLLEACSEDWVVRERDAREQAYLAALETLARQAMLRQDHAAAARWLKQVVARDLLRESACRLLMQTLAADGDYSAMTQVYARLRQYLYREMHTDPDPETEALYRQLRAEGQRRAQETQRREPLALVETPPSPPKPSPTEPIGATLFHGPQPLTGLIGREQEGADIVMRLKSTRLVTLMGPGGVGKTRLAIHVAQRCSVDFNDGVWFVDLAAVKDPASVVQAVASALELREAPKHALSDTLCEALSTRKLLLVLDNCEHVLETCAALADALLRSCPELRVLATTQHAFGIMGEYAWHVPPLPVPDVLRNAGPDPASLLRYDAVRLFVERAHAVSPGFALTPDNAAAVVDICRRLDGLPLALELAAARARVLSAEQISHGLEDRFRLLASRDLRLSERQKTLRAAMEWSWGLLSPEESSLLMRLSAFAGGVTLTAVIAVCADAIVEADAVLDTLALLCDKSLVVVEEHGGEATYRLLETTRLYAREMLEASGETLPLEDRHARYFLALTEEAKNLIKGPQQRVWLDRLSAAHEDIRRAFDYFVEGAGQAANQAVRMGAAISKYWYLRGSLTESRRLLTAALEKEPACTVQRTRVLGGVGILALEQGDLRAARTLFEECLSSAEALQDRRRVLWAHTYLGKLAEAEGNLEVARAHHEVCLQGWSEMEASGDIVTALNNLGLVAQGQGDYLAAADFHSRCKAINEEKGNLGGVAWCNANLGEVACLQQDLQTAKSYFEQALIAFRSLRNDRGVATSLIGLATALNLEQSSQRDLERITRLLGAAVGLRAARGVHPAAAEQQELEKLITRVRAGSDPDRFARAWEEGQALTMEDATGYALYESDLLPLSPPDAEMQSSRRKQSTG